MNSRTASIVVTMLFAAVNSQIELGFPTYQKPGYTGNKLNADLDRGLTPHFNNWLNANGYSAYEFQRLDLVGGAYGGKSSDSDTLKHNPIVFFHGNSDIAVGTVDLFTGFSKTIEYFLSMGYSKSEMYITTWGPGDKTKASD